MKVRFTRWYNAVLTALLSLLGYGCSFDEPEEYGAPVYEYGVPYADYTVKGTATDEAGNPIQGIKTALKTIPEAAPEYAMGIDSTNTDAAGKFELQTRGFWGLRDLKLVAEDVDGEAGGGAFQSDTIRVDDLQMQKVEDGKSWYEGKFELKADIKLKEKQ